MVAEWRAERKAFAKLGMTGSKFILRWQFSRRKKTQNQATNAMLQSIEINLVLYHLKPTQHNPTSQVSIEDITQGAGFPDGLYPSTL